MGVCASRRARRGSHVHHAYLPLTLFAARDGGIRLQNQNQDRGRQRRCRRRDVARQRLVREHRQDRRCPKSDALARYGRAEAAEDGPDDAMELQTGGETGFPDVFLSRSPK